jgi:phenylacetate-CoA ligase
LEASQRWSPDRLLELQWGRQRALVAHAVATVPFYRQRWAALGITPESLRERADWARLPVLEKRDIQEHARALTSSVAPSGLKAATSGSSGTPVTVLRSHASWAYAHAAVIRGWHWHGVEVGDRYAYLWGVPLESAGRRDADSKDRFFNRERCSAFDLDAERARRFYDRMRAHPARFAFGYPSALAQFADLVTDQKLDGRALGWKVAITTAEVLHDAQRQRIAATFGCPVADSYGCAEVGVGGFACEHGGMHVPIEATVVETATTADGQHEILLTDLHNYSQPVIRYRVGDLVEPGAGACACGRPLPTLGRLSGRGGDTLTLPDGRTVNANLPSYIFKHHGKEGTVREYQFVQFPDGRVELRVTPGPAWGAAVEPRLRVEVREALGIDVEVKVVPRFERRARGKHRDFVRADEIGE